LYVFSSVLACFCVLTKIIEHRPVCLHWLLHFLWTLFSFVMVIAQSDFMHPRLFSLFASHCHILLITIDTNHSLDSLSFTHPSTFTFSFCLGLYIYLPYLLNSHSRYIPACLCILYPCAIFQPQRGIHFSVLRLVHGIVSIARATK
jgi:hypothetical protein